MRKIILIIGFGILAGVVALVNAVRTHAIGFMEIFTFGFIILTLIGLYNLIIYVRSGASG